MSLRRTLVPLIVGCLLTLSCGEEIPESGGAWYEDVGGEPEAPAEWNAPLSAHLEAVPVELDGALRYAAVGHALVPVSRGVLEARGVAEGSPLTRLGLIRHGAAEIGLDLVDWRRKDARDLLRIRKDLAGVIHLDPKQICDRRLRAAISEASPDVVSLSFAPGPRIPRKIPACLEALGVVPLHLMVPAADGELVAALAALEGLETLILRAPDLDGVAMDAIGRSRALVTLDLGAAQVGGDALERMTGLTALESLSLFGTLVDDASMTHLTKLAGLRSLDLGFTDVGDGGLTRLSQLRELRSLSLWHTKVTDHGLEALSSLDHIVALDLAGTEIGDSGLPYLRAHDHLRRLDLTGTAITDEGLASLATFDTLEVLNIGATRITDASLLSLAAFPRLERLDLRGCAVSRGAVEALRRVRPEMDILYGQ